MIDKLPYDQVMPSWNIVKGNRYMATPSCRTAIVQKVADPLFIYVIADERLPETISEAIQIVDAWEANQCPA